MSESDIKFNISMDLDSIHLPHKPAHVESSAYVNEESLLPGTSESRETTGLLPESQHQGAIQNIEFSPLSEQHSLMDLALKSKGVDLHYELTNQNHLLIATVGDSGIAVFTAYLDPNGAYTFTLHNHIDRATPSNMLESAQASTWQEDINLDTNQVTLSQDLKTQPNEAYHLTFHYQPVHNEANNDIQIFWGDKHLFTLTGEQQAAKGYTFSVEGAADDISTQLKFITQGADNFLENSFTNLSVTSAAQTKLPIDLSYCSYDNEGQPSEHMFTVNVATTPAIQVNNQEPFDIIFDQGVYQTIIIGDELGHHGSHLTTINLDHLFKDMAIPTENRVVEVVQREENGLATNVYEVKISDKTQLHAPITVADVQLSFPGGDGGLGVFQKHISIDGGGLTPPHDATLI